jgi:hypothetical protein
LPLNSSSRKLGKRRQPSSSASVRRPHSSEPLPLVLPHMHHPHETSTRQRRDCCTWYHRPPQNYSPSLYPPRASAHSPFVVGQFLEVQVTKCCGCVCPRALEATAVRVAATKGVGAYKRNHLPAGNTSTDGMSSWGGWVKLLRSFWQQPEKCALTSRTTSLHIGSSTQVMV